jgi:hypothetical protein
MTGRLLAVLFLALAPAASAAGPPLPSNHSGRVGAVAPGGTERLTATRSGSDTTVAAVRRGDRTAVLRSNRISGRWTVPAVTLDGGTTGLSADGTTLVLVRPERDYPPATVRLAVLDTKDLTVRRHITLDGFFTVDAVSPDGSSAYLVQYAGGNPLDYRVRRLDTRTGKLAAGSIVDPREPDEQMGGFPLTRATSADGRWTYTLYTGGPETFIHALDTVGETAACIDLEMLPANGDFEGKTLALSRDGRSLVVRDVGRVVATIDTRTFAVGEPGEEKAAAETAPAPPPAPAAPRSDAPAASGDGGVPWMVLALCAVALTAVVAVVRRNGSTVSEGPVSG